MTHYVFVEPGWSEYSVKARTVRTEKKKGPNEKLVLNLQNKPIDISRGEALGAAIGIILTLAVEGDTDALAEIKAFIKSAEEMEA